MSKTKRMLENNLFLESLFRDSTALVFFGLVSGIIGLIATALTSHIYSPEMFVDASTWNTYPFNIGSYPSEGNFGPAQISRLKDMIERYVDSENLSVSTHPFNTNYSGFLIRNGKLGNVSVSY